MVIEIIKKAKQSCSTLKCGDQKLKRRKREKTQKCTQVFFLAVIRQLGIRFFILIEVTFKGIKLGNDW